ncbi:MAG: FAD-binding protein [Planctomycetes bacterium]|nr:FAD-binding protein [Planctomycetota bacterium]
MDEQERGRIRDDLKGFFQGELFFDELSRALYSTDASIFQVEPLGVAMPRNEADVQALVRYAADKQFPLVPRGAGTGMAGESIGRGLIVDLSRHFRDIREVNGDTVRVQPGVTLAALNRRLAQTGRRFAPDPASGAVCTLGGMLGSNASGAHALRHGYTRDHVLALRMVLDNGDAVDIAPLPLPIADDVAPGHLHDIATTLAMLLEQNQRVIQESQPRTRFNRCGYTLDGVCVNGRLDLPRLVVGSEGTLGFFTEATIRTVPLPGGQALVLLVFASLEPALQALETVRSHDPIACELMDRRLLSLARSGDAGPVASLIPSDAEAILLVEFETDTPAEARNAASDLVEHLGRLDRLANYVLPAYEPEEVEKLRQLRELALPSLFSVKGGAQPVPFVEDVGVPLDRLGEFLHRVQAVFQEHETTASYLVHAATGQVHTRPFLDLQNPEHVSRIGTLAEKVHTLALDLGGTVSTQHGTGLARTPWVARQTGPLYPIFRQVKAIFDPRGLFNPGKIVDPNSDQAAWPLRRIATPAPEAKKPEAKKPEQKELALHWRPLELRVEALHCNGCGHCRSEAPHQRMCPIFRATQAEPATPRAKANLLRHLLTAGDANGKPAIDKISADEVRAVADLCVNCKMCALECPAHVNIPKLMLEAKAANVAEHGLDRSEWFLARMDRLARWGSALPLFANLILRSRPTRWLLDKLFGLSPRRRLPRFSRRSFLRRARKRGWTTRPKGDRPWLAYVPDLYATYVDPQIAEAVVAVLNHNGFDVYVPAKQRGSGIEALAHGDVDTARDIAQYNLRALVEPARDGVPILCSEPSAAVMLRHDYLDLVDDADARLVARQTVEFTTFLGELKYQGKLRSDFHSLEAIVGHHVPCHLKALRGSVDGPGLLGQIPGMRVETIDVSCSGMAGTFGMTTYDFQTSLDAGRPMLAELASPAIQYGASECSSCRMQMEEGSRKRALHPAQYLALAYGLMPEIADRLKEPIRELTLR